MIVIRVQNRADGDDAVAPGPVLDHDWLISALRQPVGEQAHADIGPAPATEGQEHPHRPLRPVFRARPGRPHGVRGNQGPNASVKFRREMSMAMLQAGIR